MEIIGEKITVTTTKIAKAMKAREIELILELAKNQADAGIKYLDVSIGPATKDGPELMEWLVTNIQEKVDIPISLDSTNTAAIEAGLKVHKGQALINSASGQEGRKEPLFELAAKYNAQIVGLTMTDQGIPRDANERTVVAFDLITVAQCFGVKPEDIYFDPLILLISVQQDQARKAIDALAMFQELSDPPTKTTIGLTNIYNGTPEKVHKWVGGTFLGLMLKAGLTTPIADPKDKELLGVKDKTIQLIDDPSLKGSDQDFINIQKTMDIIDEKDLFAASYID